MKLAINMSEGTLIELYNEIVKVRRLLEISLKDTLKRELESILTTEERKRIWALSDGFTDTGTIARRTGLSRRAVQIALRELQDADLITVERRGYPKRNFDFVPPSWRISEES